MDARLPADEISFVFLGAWLAISLLTGKTLALISPDRSLICDRRAHPRYYWLTTGIVAAALILSGWWIVRLWR